MTNQEQTSEQQRELKQLKNKIEKLKEKLEQCEQEKEEYLSGWKRARADLENYKKQEQDRLEQAKQAATKEMVLKLLPVLDSFDRAEENLGGLEKGLQQIRRELQSVLSRQGVERIETEQEFDPALHQAVEQVPSEQEPGTIVEEVNAGYKFKDQVIRAAEVKVAAEQEPN